MVCHDFHCEFFANQIVKKFKSGSENKYIGGYDEKNKSVTD